MVIAIDGPAGVGKSSLAQRIAAEHGFFYLNSGAFYRAIALCITESGLENSSEEQWIVVAQNAELDIVEGNLHLNGKNVENLIRNDKIDHWSSKVSTVVAIRHAVNRHLRRIAASLNLVAEGRDMTTVVFPEAELKIYLDASPQVRARRRYNQGSSGMSLEDIEQSIRSRDERDRNKKEGSLKIAKDSLVLDSSVLTLDEVYERVRKFIISI